jgi:hypothetical protein
MKKLLASLALAIAAFGMVGGSASAATTMTARQVAAKLVRLGCKAASPTDGWYVGSIKPKTELVCTVNGEDVTIDEFRNAGERSYNNMLAKRVGCVDFMPFGITGAIFIEADDLYVSSTTVTTAHLLQHAIGNGNGNGTFTIHCA